MLRLSLYIPTHPLPIRFRAYGRVSLKQNDPDHTPGRQAYTDSGLCSVTFSRLLPSRYLGALKRTPLAFVFFAEMAGNVCIALPFRRSTAGLGCIVLHRYGTKFRRDPDRAAREDILGQDREYGHRIGLYRRRPCRDQPALRLRYGQIHHELHC